MTKKISIRGLNINIEQNEMKVADSVTFFSLLCQLAIIVLCIRKKKKFCSRVIREFLSVNKLISSWNKGYTRRSMLKTIPVLVWKQTV